MIYPANILKTVMLFILLAATPLISRASVQCTHLHSHSHDKQLFCLKSNFVAADMLLNDAYKNLMAKMADVPADRALLKVAQKSWIKFRDDDCTFGAVTHAGSGNRASIGAMSCKLERTKERIEQLKNMIDCPADYFFCPMN
ncbi:lysozyme inhibitor LprI family protein [Acerihabitans arboris]|uniref:DUF1311 domain-containing protein n=1 Tax=Acerihabitans arboris TaxID=2691583 RepID=A0A845SNA7_9GAMM|nr:lysozyme inhibitor LprI family protein [Acerihabitans arboris]NDL64872.1 DUF1311 domain-containing protein [Acerihabitans arboris]